MKVILLSPTTKLPSPKVILPSPITKLPGIKVNLPSLPEVSGFDYAKLPGIKVILPSPKVNLPSLPEESGFIKAKQHYINTEYSNTAGEINGTLVKYLYPPSEGLSPPREDREGQVKNSLKTGNQNRFFESS